MFENMNEQEARAKILEQVKGYADKFHTVNNDTGISFAMPLSSVIGKLTYGFLSNDERLGKGNR